MKAKVVGVLVAVKRIILVSLTLWILSTVWKLELLRQRANSMAFAASKMLTQRLAAVEEAMNLTAAALEDDLPRRRTGKTAPAPSYGAPALRGLLAGNPWLEQAAWVQGNGKENIVFARIGTDILQKPSNGGFKDSLLLEAHHKGQVVVSPLEYQAKGIPFFYISYPLNGQEGGFIMGRVNLWEFLKIPANLSQDMVGRDFDFEILDKDGKMLAHRKGGADPVGSLATRFFKAVSKEGRLDLEVKLTPTRQALFDTLRPGRVIWYCLGIAVALCFLL